MASPLIQYFKTTDQRAEYIGVRYFRFDYQNEICTQVCRSGGEHKRGKSNTPGIYVINKISFFSNYLGPGYVRVITKKEFDKQFDEVVSVLR